MIKRKNNYIYIKDIEAPKVLTATIRSITVENENKKASGQHKIDLIPTGFFGRSDIYADLKDYIAYVLKEIFDMCFISGNVGDFLKTFKNQPKDSLAVLSEIVIDPRKAIDNTAFYGKLEDRTSLFSDLKVRFDDVEFDMDNYSNMFDTGKEAFYFLFCMNSEYSIAKTGVRYSSTCSDIRLYDVVKMCCNIFFFFLSKKRRIEVVSDSINKLETKFEGCELRAEILNWDYNLEKYIYYLPKFKNKFLVSDIASGITVKHVMTEKYNNLEDRLKNDGGEKFNPFERIKLEALKFVNNETFITLPNKIFDKNFVSHPYDNLNSYIGYRGYSSGNNGLVRDAAVSVNLYTEFTNKDSNLIYNMIIYGRDLFFAIFEQMPNLNVGYEILDAENFKAALQNSDIKFKVDVCYYSKGGGGTFKSFAELEKAKIPKDKRDYVFEVLCNICYELDVDPMEVINKLNVDFVRYYKKPIELNA